MKSIATRALPAAAVLVIPFLNSCSRPPAVPPYSPSDLIERVEFDWQTHRRLAPGSDNWPITWAADDNQYTSWGDGGGFGGSNHVGRVSMGVARVEGDFGAGNGTYVGINVWGGKDALRPAAFGGKSYGIIALTNTLYMWVSGDESEATAYKFQRLYCSEDHGLTWKSADWQFGHGNLPEPEELADKSKIFLFTPTFLQFGKGYQGARDDYVYTYAPRITSGSAVWQNQQPGEVFLMRAPADKLMDRTAYEFFKTNSNGDIEWTKLSPDAPDRIILHTGQATPVFIDPNGAMRTSVIYSPGLRRYLLISEHAPRSHGNIGIFESVDPWGPWKTVLYADGWGSPPAVPETTFFWNLSPKWMSEDGLSFVLVFTGIKENDAWNTVRGRFILH